ncbi:hypothetical protein [Flavobacterium psychrotolerans]|uniref:Uncharacterized protein n=1 Tax=Flavobacterium psychrotolerans TaxID=2169410 RepID=A0A2U1JK12_9FLAO|nr:hypothetical protein [Flavobacterium psychrotolerans]PWA05218.1 hypothetical protein DB895_07920 [Flavobacterium psychrotolerans]
MKERNEFELIVSQPKNSLWKIIVSGLFYAFAVRAILCIVFLQHYSRLDPDEAEFFNKNIMVAMICLVGGIYFSVRLTILIDTANSKLISRYFLGFFSVNFKTEIPELKYVSISKNEDEIYLIDLWYRANKYYNMCYSEEKDLAFKFAEMVAEKLHINFLDATEKGNSKWIEKPNS